MLTVLTWTQNELSSKGSLSIQIEFNIISNTVSGVVKEYAIYYVVQKRLILILSWHNSFQNEYTDMHISTLPGLNTNYKIWERAQFFALYLSLWSSSILDVMGSPFTRSLAIGLTFSIKALPPSFVMTACSFWIL